ncbi:MAG: hypothetical protein ACQCN3_06005 [Candidatus Bathyarchaeia archaeon]
MPFCKHSAIDRDFRLVMLLSAQPPSDKYDKHEVLYSRICPNCNIVFYDRQYDEAKRP